MKQLHIGAVALAAVGIVGCSDTVRSPLEVTEPAFATAPTGCWGGGWPAIPSYVGTTNNQTTAIYSFYCGQTEIVVNAGPIEWVNGGPQPGSYSYSGPGVDGLVCAQVRTQPSTRRCFTATPPSPSLDTPVPIRIHVYARPPQPCEHWGVGTQAYDLCKRGKRFRIRTTPSGGGVRG